MSISLGGGPLECDPPICIRCAHRPHDGPCPALIVSAWDLRGRPCPCGRKP